ncbi:hypothetical protein LCGC14_0175140 [marine sediment metagenome]|uniref:Uncharacterized protein n=1 Tax=marine sediment metagenome TaxID=412755 RepID=A0A0F9UR76_9ZZZZ
MATEPELENEPISIGNKRIEAKFKFEKGVEITPHNLKKYNSPKRVLARYDRWMGENSYICFIHATEEELDKLFAELDPINGQRMKKEKIKLSNCKAGITEEGFMLYNIHNTFYPKSVDKYIKRWEVLIYYMPEIKNYPIWIKFKKNWFFGMTPIIMKEDIENLSFP